MIASGVKTKSASMQTAQCVLTIALCLTRKVYADLKIGVLTMAEYIDRGALIEWLKRIRLIDLSDGRGLCRVIMEDDFKKAIKKMPKGIIADVDPVRHGRWVPFHSEAAGDIQYCSACEIGFDAKTDYCPNCGAKMDGGAIDGDV